MTDRLLDFSESPARLSVRYDQLIVERPEQERLSIPLAEIAVLSASHPQLRYSQAVLAGLAEHGAIFVVCDRRQAPVAMMLPLQSHHVQAERFAQQARASEPARKRLWKQIVQAKIRAQSRTLLALHGTDGGLGEMAKKVRSGDPHNLEAHAAQRYWPRVFGDPKFRRRREAPDQNRDLNYGYAVLRAIAARAIAAAGLHPSLGLHHGNRYNAFCLADDLMEPYRPIVDRAVALSIREWGPRTDFGRGEKQDVLEALTARFEWEGESRTLFDWLARASQSLAAVFAGRRRLMELPEL